MADIFNPDFKDFVNALNVTKVRYVLIGGYSVIIHSYNRTTGDVESWVESTEDNFIRLHGLSESLAYLPTPLLNNIFWIRRNFMFSLLVNHPPVLNYLLKFKVLNLRKLILQRLTIKMETLKSESFI